MADDQNRRFEQVRLDARTIESLLMPAAERLGGGKVASVELIDSGLTNTNYRVQLADNPKALVLKIYMRQPETCRKEYELFKLVHQTVPVATIYYADFQGEKYARPYSIFEWMPGVLLEELLSAVNTTEMQAVGRAVGETLAGIGKYQFEQAGFFGPDLKFAAPQVEQAGEEQGWRAYLESCLENPICAERLDKTLKTRLTQFIRTNAHQVEALGEQKALVHADFNPSNILMVQTETGWRVSAVLDWEWAHSGTPLFDIGNLFRDRGYSLTNFETGFVEGYRRAGGELPENWKQVSRLLDLINLCEFLTVPNQSDTRVSLIRQQINVTIEG
ncbi:MAG TPA: aminoglycoside phosphotransferase family protein [Chloroflexia bacterium]|nr:aminoglycoside phosphotransferase family protein [Chloroflexia bacterium]